MLYYFFAVQLRALTLPL